MRLIIYSSSLAFDEFVFVACEGTVIKVSTGEFEVY